MDKARIVVVDDDADTRTVCSALIESAGMEAVSFGEPVDVIDYLTRGIRADVLLSDVVLPQMSGLALSKLVGKASPSLPVVLMTGFTDQVEAAIAQGDLPLLKPFTRDQLLQSISDALSRRKVDGPQPPPSKPVARAVSTREHWYRMELHDAEHWRTFLKAAWSAASKAAPLHAIYLLTKVDDSGTRVIYMRTSTFFLLRQLAEVFGAKRSATPRDPALERYDVRPSGGEAQLQPQPRSGAS